MSGPSRGRKLRSNCGRVAASTTGLLRLTSTEIVPILSGILTRYARLQQASEAEITLIELFGLDVFQINPVVDLP